MTESFPTICGTPIISEISMFQCTIPKNSTNITMFKCRSCTYVDSHVDGKGSRPMCNNKLLSRHGDLDSILDVVEATGLALDPTLVGSEVKVVGKTGCRNLESILDKVEAGGLALDPSSVGSEVKIVDTTEREKKDSVLGSGGG